MGKKILVIDDSPTLLKFITKHLSAHVENYEVTTALTATIGLEAARRDTPDLILLDFMLPDMNGETVCEQLTADSATASIPVILMSSSAPDITRTESRFNIVKRSMVKPFTPELLVATVGQFFKDNAPASSATSAPAPTGTPVFSGDTACFPLLDVLLAPAKKSLTGLLRLHFDGHTVELYFTNGSLHLATTRDVDFYLLGTPIEIPPDQQDLFNELKQKQRETGSPVFLQMLERNLAPAAEAEAMIEQYGCALLSPAWTSPQARFDFSDTAPLPDFLDRLQNPGRPMAAWAFDSLRQATPDITALNLGDGSGIPAYTRQGYERIQQLNLSEEEVAFATHAGSGTLTLAEIATLLQISHEAAAAIFFRYSVLAIFDYWTPAA